MNRPELRVLKYARHELDHRVGLVKLGPVGAVRGATGSDLGPDLENAALQRQWVNLNVRVEPRIARIRNMLREAIINQQP